MHEEILEPCPLCGSHEVHSAIISDKRGRNVYNVECTNCGCATGNYDRAHDAIKVWNKRFEKKGYALMPCPLCGGSAEIGHYGYLGEEINTDFYAVRCSVCHFSTSNTNEDALNEVVSGWNRRA